MLLKAQARKVEEDFFYVLHTANDPMRLQSEVHAGHDKTFTSSCSRNSRTASAWGTRTCFLVNNIMPIMCMAVLYVFMDVRWLYVRTYWMYS